MIRLDVLDRELPLQVGEREPLRLAVTTRAAIGLRIDFEEVDMANYVTAQDLQNALAGYVQIADLAALSSEVAKLAALPSEMANVEARLRAVEDTVLPVVTLGVSPTFPTNRVAIMADQHAPAINFTDGRPYRILLQWLPGTVVAAPGDDVLWSTGGGAFKHITDIDGDNLTVQDVTERIASGSIMLIQYSVNRFYVRASG